MSESLPQYMIRANVLFELEYQVVEGDLTGHVVKTHLSDWTIYSWGIILCLYPQPSLKLPYYILHRLMCQMSDTRFFVLFYFSHTWILIMHLRIHLCAVSLKGFSLQSIFPGRTSRLPLLFSSLRSPAPPLRSAVPDINDIIAKIKC